MIELSHRQPAHGIGGARLCLSAAAYSGGPGLPTAQVRARRRIPQPGGASHAMRGCVRQRTDAGHIRS